MAHAVVQFISKLSKVHHIFGYPDMPSAIRDVLSIAIVEVFV